MRKIFLLSVCNIMLFTNAAMAFSLSGAEYVFLAKQTGRSCELQMTSWDKGADDLPDITAFIGGMSLQWDKNFPLHLESMNISFQAKELVDGFQRITVEGRELNYLWTNDGDSNVVENSTSTNPFCKFKVGGLKVIDPSKHFESNGMIALRGWYEAYGERYEVEARLPFRFHMTPYYGKK